MFRSDSSNAVLRAVAIPTAIAAFVIHAARLMLFDRKLGRRA